MRTNHLTSKSLFSILLITLLAITFFSISLFSSPANAALGNFLYGWGREYRIGGSLGIAVDSDRNIYITTPANSSVHVYDNSGKFLRKWGSGGSGAGQFSNPTGIAVDSTGTVYVVDTNNNRIQVFSSSGAFLRNWGSFGYADGQFNNPLAVALDGSGNVYVVDYGNNRVQVFNNNGVFLRSWSSVGFGDGQFYGPLGIAIDASGNVYVSDFERRIQVFSNTGTFLKQWRTDESGYGGIYPQRIAVDNTGKVFVSDGVYHTVKVFSNTGAFLTQYAVHNPFGVAIDHDDNLYVSGNDDFNHNTTVRLFSNTGVVIRQFDVGDGFFYYPAGIAKGPSGDVYVADAYNYRLQVFDNAGTYLNKWAGFLYPLTGIAVDSTENVYVANGDRIQVFSNSGTFLRQWGSWGSGDGQFMYPRGIAVDLSGSVYVADYINSRVQIFNQDGSFLRKWGTLGTGDGEFIFPSGIAVNASGNVYVVDTYNNRIQVFSNTGTFLKKWGSYGTGDGQFMNPYGIALDESGNVYVLDTGNNRIQAFTASGTFLGKWGYYGSGDGQLSYPQGIAIDGDSRVYVSDTGNNRIQVFDGRVTDTEPPVTIAMATGTLGNNGWYVSDVFISLSATDAGSGVKEIRYSIDGGAEVVIAGGAASASLTTDGTHSFTYYAIDNAGNKETAHTLSIKIDKTPPTITASASPLANANGWNNTNVAVAFTCSDATSGMASCTGPLTVTTEGANQVITGTAVDNAGNTATASLTLSIDKTPPSVSSLSASPSILWPPNHKLVDVTIGGGASDSLSGVASVVITVADEYGAYNMTVPGFGSTIQLEAWREGTDRDGRTYTITAVVTDKAGNATTATTTVLVPHDMR